MLSISLTPRPMVDDDDPLTGGLFRLLPFAGLARQARPRGPSRPLRAPEPCHPIVPPAAMLLGVHAASPYPATAPGKFS